MVQNIKKSMFVLLAFTLLLAGCKSKSALQQSQEEGIEESIIIDGLAAVTPDTVALQYMSANANIRLNVSGSDISFKGKLRVKRNEGVQISITPLGIIEAACIEFMPKEIRFINKLSKTYTEVPYSEAKAIGLSGINYKVIEAIFLDYAFLPDGRLACQGVKELAVEDKGENYHIATKGNTAMQYSFLVDKESGMLVSCNGLSSTGESIKCDYAGFARLDNIMFPNEMSLNFKGDAAIKLDFVLNKASNKSFSLTTRNINSSYRKQSIGDFIKSIK